MISVSLIPSCQSTVIRVYRKNTPIKDTPKKDKPPNKRQAESTLVYTLYRKSPLKENNLSTKDETAGPKSVPIKRFHCKRLYGLLGFIFNVVLCRFIVPYILTISSELVEVSEMTLHV